MKPSANTILYLLTAVSYPLGYFVIIPLLAKGGNYSGADPAGRGMAQGMGLLMGLVVWTLISLVITIGIACAKPRQRLGPVLAINFLSIMFSVQHALRYL